MHALHFLTYCSTIVHTQICPHNRQKRFCEECPGNHLCTHKKCLYNCFLCNGKSRAQVPAADPHKFQELLGNLQKYAVDMENMGRAEAIEAEHVIFNEHVVLSRDILRTLQVPWNGQVHKSYIC